MVEDVDIDATVCAEVFFELEACVSLLRDAEQSPVLATLNETFSDKSTESIPLNGLQLVSRAIVAMVERSVCVCVCVCAVGVFVCLCALGVCVCVWCV